MKKCIFMHSYKNNYKIETFKKKSSFIYSMYYLYP